MEKIIKQLKEVSEQLDVLIISAHCGMRKGALTEYQVARRNIQEAISRLLEVT
mgnify:FL=1